MVDGPDHSPFPGRNFLFQALPPRAREQLLSRADVVSLSQDQLVLEEGRPVEHAYFPDTAVISLVSILDGRETVEVATVGNEGMVGLAPFLGVGTALYRAVCQIGGRAHRVPVVGLIEEAGRSPPLDVALRRYAQTSINQVTQTAACNCSHPAPLRLARWLLMVHDRVGDAPFDLPHRSIARMLGVRRATITVAASALQRDGMISYRRGRVVVSDRARLEAAACGCYRVLRQEFDRLLP